MCIRDRVYTTPATCFQFRSNSADFALGDQPPGYRWIELHPEGKLTTGCVFLQHSAPHLDHRLARY